MGGQVPGLEALQRADLLTLCLDVPDCVGAGTDHAMGYGENSHRQECLGVSSGQLTQHHDHLIALPGRATAEGLSPGLTSLGDLEVTLGPLRRVELSQLYMWLGMEDFQGPRDRVCGLHWAFP